MQINNYIRNKVKIEMKIKNKVNKYNNLEQERTILANERTMLAYVRTGLAAFVLGFALIKLFEDNLRYVYSGYGIIVFGGLLIILGLIYYNIRKRKILLYK